MGNINWKFIFTFHKAKALSVLNKWPKLLAGGKQVESRKLDNDVQYFELNFDKCLEISICTTKKEMLLSLKIRLHVSVHSLQEFFQKGLQWGPCELTFYAKCHRMAV